MGSWLVILNFFPRPVGFPVMGFSRFSKNHSSVTGVYSEFTKGGLAVGAGGVLVL